MKHTLILGGVLALLSPFVHASNVIWNYATGQGTSTGQVDPTATGSYRYDWANQWAGFGTASVYVITPNNVPSSPSYSYATPPGTAAWTSLYSNGAAPNLGAYTFIYSFSNPGAATSAVFNMQFLADDQVTDIKLNGTSIYGSRGALGSWSQITTLDPIQVDLASGKNTLEVVVTNTTYTQMGQTANMGLAATYSFSTVNPIPEPTTAALSLVAAAGFVLRRRR